MLIGTQTIEQSIDLQVARHMINIDTILNPARMTQLAGRLKRDGSAFAHVYIHTLVVAHSQEVGYQELLEQALIDHIWDDRSELYEALPPVELLKLIGAAS